MVRALVATQLNVGRGKITIGEFESVIASGNCTMADFGAPAKGLFLDQVEYPYSIDLQKVL
ncbi:MAG TPA: tRNA pseudouridine(38-40) synthase TruA, partial [Chitinophagaceae bacterium]|nr:tRNA pseudouridine(38-40) synthase TruA [Chitinophagaceae bacterium]